MSKNKFKKFIKTKILDAAFQYLKREQDSKSKVKEIQYTKLKLQKYLKSSLFSNYEVEMLFRIRSCTIDVKTNFKSKYEKNNIENLQCRMENCTKIEDQQHLLNCKPILSQLPQSFDLKNIFYKDLFSKTKKQKKVVELFIALLDTRSSILEYQEKVLNNRT